jgi:hypothetical protein
MPLTRRYSPEWAPAEVGSIGMDFSAIIPPGVGIASGKLDIASNTVPPVASSDFTVAGAPQVIGRAVYATVSGGVGGKDYQFTWTATDTNGNAWPRTALLLCAPTS